MNIIYGTVIKDPWMHLGGGNRQGSCTNSACQTIQMASYNVERQTYPEIFPFIFTKVTTQLGNFYSEFGMITPLKPSAPGQVTVFQVINTIP